MDGCTHLDEECVSRAINTVVPGLSAMLKHLARGANLVDVVASRALEDYLRMLYGPRDGVKKLASMIRRKIFECCTTI